MIMKEVAAGDGGDDNDVGDGGDLPSLDHVIRADKLACHKGGMNLILFYGDETGSGLVIFLEVLEMRSLMNIQRGLL
jgi:hypothetical protein